MDSHLLTVVMECVIFMGSFLFDDMDFQEFSTRLLVPLFVTLLFLQGFRTFVVGLYVAIWNIIWYDASIVPMVAMAALLVPLFGIGIGRKVSDRSIMISAGILAAVFALPTCLGGQLELLLGSAAFGLASAVELLFSTLVVACYSLFLPSYVASQITGESGTTKDSEVKLFAAGFSLALAYDIMIRSFNMMYDVSRTFLYIIPQTIIVLIILVLLVKEYHIGESKRPRVLGVSGVSASRLGGVLLPVGIGMILFLEIGLVANPYAFLLTSWSYPFYLLELVLFVVFSVIMLGALAFVLLLKGSEKWNRLNWWVSILLINVANLVSVVGAIFIGTVGIIWVHAFLVLDLIVFLVYIVRRQFRWGRFTMLSLSFFFSLIFLVLFCFMTGFAYAYAYLGSIGAIFEGQVPTLLIASAIILLLTSTITAYKIGGDVS